MIWERECSIIVMLTNMIESGTRKCDRYWPDEADEALQFDFMIVTFCGVEQFDGFLVRKFKLRNEMVRSCCFGLVALPCSKFAPKIVLIRLSELHSTLSLASRLRAKSARCCRSR